MTLLRAISRGIIIEVTTALASKAAVAPFRIEVLRMKFKQQMVKQALVKSSLTTYQ
jgi:hypothetical protein